MIDPPKKYKRMFVGTEVRLMNAYLVTCTGYEADEDIISSKFMYYIMKSRENEMNSMKRGAGVPHASGEALSEMVYIIPSKEKQREIVNILDKSNALCNDMESGLPAEIEARTKQYEYYRDKLLSFKRKDTA